MKFNTSILTLFVLPSFFLLSCTNDSTTQEEETPSYAEASLYGYWELVEGYRNNQLTETLTNTFYEFSEGGQMITNLGGMRDKTTFELEGNILSQKSERLPIDYTIEELTSSGLTLSMTMRDIPFLLKLERVIQEADVPAIDSLQ